MAQRSGEEKEGSVLALLGALSLGALCGAAFGLLFAPAAGSEIRARLALEASRLRRSTEDLVDQLGKRLSGVLERLPKERREEPDEE